MFRFLKKQGDGSAAARIANIALVVQLCPDSRWGWGNDGHKIVAIIAADNLTKAAQLKLSEAIEKRVERTVLRAEKLAQSILAKAIPGKLVLTGLSSPARRPTLSDCLRTPSQAFVPKLASRRGIELMRRGSRPW